MTGSLKIIKHLLNVHHFNEALKAFFTELSANNMDDYSNKEWISSLISILPKASRSALSRVLNKLLVMPSTSLKEAECIVENCGMHVELQPSISSDSILSLFENIVSNQEIATWFDSQNINFEDWDEESINSFVSQLTILEDDRLIFDNFNSIKLINEAKKGISQSIVEEQT